MAELMSLSKNSSILKSSLKAELPPNLAAAVEKAARKKLYSFYEGLNTYAAAPIKNWQPDAKIIWQEGSTRILDYSIKGKTGCSKILFISPLINRANILDLSGGKSLMKFLANQGYQPLLVDWGNPDNSEKKFDSDAYINRLKKFCESQKNLVIGGYCMGGLLALKLAKNVNAKALVLLATPWNFHAPDVKRVEFKAGEMKKILDGLEYVPPEFIQSLFISADPWRVYDKYADIGQKGAAKSSNMMEIEQWVNNGVLMPVPMAKECIIEWAIKNTPGKNQWLDVGDLTMPVYLGCPVNDKIVPIGSSIPLAGLLKNAELQKFNCGHIGMLTQKLCFEPLAGWLIKHS